MNEEMDLHDLQGPNDTPAEDRTTEPRTETGRDLLRRCESGWKTWMDEPIRVNGMRRMILAIEAEAAQGKEERAAQSHNSGHQHVWRCDYCEALPEGAQGAAPLDDDESYVDPPDPKIWEGLPKTRWEGAAPLAVDALANIIRQEDGDHSLGAGALAERILARWGAAPRAEGLGWPDPKLLANALYRDYDYTVTPEDIRNAYARLSRSSTAHVDVREMLDR